MKSQPHAHLLSVLALLCSSALALVPWLARASVHVQTACYAVTRPQLAAAADSAAHARSAAPGQALVVDTDGPLLRTAPLHAERRFVRRAVRSSTSSSARLEPEPRVVLRAAARACSCAARARRGVRLHLHSR